MVGKNPSCVIYGRTLQKHAVVEKVEQKMMPNTWNYLVNSIARILYPFVFWDDSNPRPSKPLRIEPKGGKTRDGYLDLQSVEGCQVRAKNYVVYISVVQKTVHYAFALCLMHQLPFEHWRLNTGTGHYLEERPLRNWFKNLHMPSQKTLRERTRERNENEDNLLRHVKFLLLLPANPNETQ